MALVEEPYFPPLETCLSGNSPLIPWSFAFEWLCNTSGSDGDSFLATFLASENSLRLLTDAINGFPKPSSQAKSALETRTAAIVVTPIAHGHYNVEEIKQDALWLSHETNLDEVEALRITTIEWQNRPKDGLRKGFSETEAASVHKVLGALSSFETLARSSGPSVDHEHAPSFLSVGERRLRLLKIYLDERRSLLGAYGKLISVALLDEVECRKSNNSTKPKNIPSKSLTAFRELGKSLIEKSTQAKSKRTEGSERMITSCIEALQARLDSLEHGNRWHESVEHKEDITNDWVICILYELIVLSDLVLLNVRNSRQIPKSSIITPWFQIVCKYSFFGNFPAQSEKVAQLVSLLQLSASTTSVALLDLATSVAYLLDSQTRLLVEQETDESFFYFFDRSNVADFHELFLKLAGARIPLASPAVFAWGIVLYTIRELGLSAKETREGQQVQKALDQGQATEHQQDRRFSSSSLGSAQQSIYEDIVDQVRTTSVGEDPVAYLIHSAIDGCHVFDVIAETASALPTTSFSPLTLWRRMTLLDLVKMSLESIGYTPEILTATLAILGDRDQGEMGRQAFPHSPRADLASAFLSDSLLMSRIFDVSVARFPYETLPFISLCTALAEAGRLADTGQNVIAERLLRMRSFTHVVPPGFSGYRTVREEENANLVCLEQPLDIQRLPESKPLGVHTDLITVHAASLVPTGTTGQVISDSRPIVIMWYHDYSGLEFLGKWLEFYQNGQQAEFMHQADACESVISGIIGLLTSLVRAVNREDACSLLEEASNGLNSSSDIVLVVSEIFEQQIQGLRLRRAADGALKVVRECIEFLNVIVQLLPGRVWPLLARSSFLNIGGAGSLLLSIVSTEATLGTYHLLESSVELCDRLLEDTLTRAASQTHHVMPREYKRLSPTTGSGAPTHVVTNVLLAFFQVMAEIHESLFGWQFKSIMQQARIRTGIIRAFRKSLDYGLRIDDNENVVLKLTSVASSVAPFVLDFFRPDSPSDTNLNSLLRVLADGLQEQDPHLDENLFQAQVEQTCQTLWLCHGLLRAARLKQNVTFLERQLCQVFPVLIRLYATNDRYRLPCLKIMSELVTVGFDNESDSSPLLSFLGTGSSKNLLEILSTLDKPHSDTEVCVAIWDLLTALLSVRQQWFAIYLLTGSSPKEKLKIANVEENVHNNGLRGTVFLTIALDELSHIESLENDRATVMLSFVCRAQENWSWVSTSLQSHPEFFPSIMSYVGKLNVRQGSTLHQCHQHKIAAIIAELSIMYLHFARANREFHTVQKMIPAFKWYADHAVHTPSYNTSLHANLRRNFKTRYSSCDIFQFKKTAYSSPKYGQDFFFDIEIATKMLSFDRSWTGTARSPGFAHEFRLANMNLSLVDSQVRLLHSFKALCIEHSTFFVQDREVQKLMAQIVRNCLAANSQTCPVERIFESLFETRIELAISLLQGLVDLKARGSEFSTLLVSAWETTRFRNGSYDAAVSNDDLIYYRSCLTTLLLCIQLHMERHTKQPSSTGQTSHNTTRSVVLEILSNIVAQGFGQVSSALCDQAQSQRASSTTSKSSANSEVGLRDFSLLLSILQSSLRVTTLSQMVAQVSSVFISSNMIDSVLRLYSWSHKLLPPQADPIYSSYALSFLVALSSLPPVAEELGIEGILNRISTSRITSILQSMPEGVDPFEPVRKPKQYPHQQRLFIVWSEGLLPLCLNLLHSVGRPMAAEIASFLNQFPEQLARASVAFAYNPASKDPSAGAISLLVAAEATTLALISHVLSSYRAAGASAGVDSFDIPILARYDEAASKKALKADIDELLNRKALLRSRVVATNERELAWAKTKPKPKMQKAGQFEAENLLEMKIAAELKSALLCLNGDDSGGE